MMAEDNTLQDYTDLILERDRLSKEAELYRLDYIKRFGELIEKSFSLKIECIRCKKIISEYLKAVNRGAGSKGMTLEQIRKAVNAEMASYEEQLKSIAAIRAQTGTVTSYELAQIKKIYHKIATRIHPDINPQLFGNEEVKELWENVTSAYRSNDLDRMKELEAVASTVIAKYCGDVVAVVIGDLDEKIEEIKAQIAEIKSTDPYQYKYLLEDEEACVETEKNLKSEIEEYQEYLDYLNSQMEALGIS